MIRKLARMIGRRMHQLVLALLIPLWLTSNQQLNAQEVYWERHTIDSGLSGADGVRLADINQDGLADIATGWEEGGYTKVYLHPGHSKVRNPWPGVVVGHTPSVEDAVFADVDNNGILDVVSSCEGETRKIFICWAPESIQDLLDQQQWSSQEIPVVSGRQQWMFVLPVASKSGKTNLLAGSKGPGAKIGWLENPENPPSLEAWKWNPISEATWIMSMIMEDMDTDGDLDVVVSDRKPGDSNGIRWLVNPGNDQPGGFWKSHFISNRNQEVMFMDMADLDGDGLIDVLACEYSSQTITLSKRLDASGLHWETVTIPIPAKAGRAKAVKAGDMNGDGQLDIVFSANTLANSDRQGVWWLSSRGDPFQSQWQWHPISGPQGYKFDRLELLDLDGDGDLDVLTCEENYGPESKGLGVIWYENRLSVSGE